MNMIFLAIIGTLILIFVGLMLFMQKNKTTNAVPSNGNRQLPSTNSENAAESAQQQKAKQVAETIANSQRLLEQQRYDDAANVLNTGLKQHPNNPQLLLKLLNLYAITNDQNAFSGVYEKIMNTGDMMVMQEAESIKGLMDQEQEAQKSMSNIAPTAAVAGAASATAAVASSTVSDDGGLAFDLSGSNESDSISTTEAAKQPADDGAGLAFDLSNSTDVDSGDSGLSMQSPASTAASNEDAGLAFDLSLDSGDSAASPVTPATDDTSVSGQTEQADAGLAFDLPSADVDTTANEAAADEHVLDLSDSLESLNEAPDMATQDSATQSLENELNTLSLDGFEADGLSELANTDEPVVEEESGVFDLSNEFDEAPLNLDAADLDTNTNLETDLNALETDLEATLETTANKLDVDSDALSLDGLNLDADEGLQESLQTQLPELELPAGDSFDMNVANNDVASNELSSPVVEEVDALSLDVSNAIETQTNATDSHEGDALAFNLDDAVLNTETAEVAETKVNDAAATLETDLADFNLQTDTQPTETESDSLDEFKLDIDANVSTDASIDSTPTLDASDSSTQDDSLNNLESLDLDLGLNDVANTQADDATNSLDLASSDTLAQLDALNTADFALETETVTSETDKLNTEPTQTSMPVVEDVSLNEVSTSTITTANDADVASDFGFIDELDSMQVTMSLASQYLELGEYDSAKRLLVEVIEQGSAEQQQQAKQLLAHAG